MDRPSAACWSWGDEERSAGLVKRAFRVEANGRSVPGLLWRTAQQHSREARPLVLLQHGGSGHKADDAVLDQVRLLVGDAGFGVATIDGPIHGDRATAARLSGEAMRERFLEQWRTDPRIDEMVADWQATYDGLVTLPTVDAARTGWLGVSMGTAYGLPFVASCPQIKAAVLGKWAGDHPNSERLKVDAPRVRCSVLFIQRWDDELFSREGQLDLFDRIGSADKRLHVYPGSHFDRGGDPLADAIEHLRKHLT